MACTPDHDAGWRRDYENAPFEAHDFFVVRQIGIHPGFGEPYLPVIVQQIDGRLYAPENELEALAFGREEPTVDWRKADLVWRLLPTDWLADPSAPDSTSPDAALHFDVGNCPLTGQPCGDFSCDPPRRICADIAKREHAASASATPIRSGWKYVYVKRWRTLICVPESIACEVVTALKEPAAPSAKVEEIRMAEVRLCAGEGKLSANDMLAACNAVLRMRVQRHSPPTVSMSEREKLADRIATIDAYPARSVRAYPTNPDDASNEEIILINAKWRDLIVSALRGPAATREITDEACEAGAAVMADLPTIDAPKLPSPCWMGSVRAILEAALPHLSFAAQVSAPTREEG